MQARSRLQRSCSVARPSASFAFAAVALALGGSGCTKATPSAAPDAAIAVREGRATSAPSDAEAPDDGGFGSASAELGSDPRDGGAARALAAPVKAQASFDVPAGSFPCGSTPGDEGRDPALEPALVPVALGAFAIDALPYPNDPALPPKAGVSRDEASKLCEERGARLCTEVEWERACKGPAFDTFASGPTWNPACDRSPSLCASGFGPRALGFLREWTASSFEGGAAVVRGGEGSLRRCGARSRATGATTGVVGFRCCRGPANSARVPVVGEKPPFRKTTIDAAELAKIFADVPELARIGRDVRLFAEPDVRAIKARSNAPAEGIVFAPAPILWSPELGVELLVATGRGKNAGFVVALWRLPDDKYRFASSFLMLRDVAPVVLAYEPSRRKELRWTSCWGCAGEQGGVSYRDDGRVVIVQH